MPGINQHEQNGGSHCPQSKNGEVKKNVKVNYLHPPTAVTFIKYYYYNTF